jgi:O-antigen/teichoic acid export membrane protein
MNDTTQRKSGDDTHKALKGSLWTLVGYGGSQVLRLVGNLILARLLFPEAFGLMALVNVFMQGLQMFSDVGIGPGIIQRKGGTSPAFLRTAWSLQVIRGFSLWLLTLVLAYPVSRFFAANNADAASLAYLLPVTGLTALLGGFTSTSVFTLNRALAMRKLTLLELVPQAVSLLAMIAWGLCCRSVWALVAGGLVYSLTRLVMSHLWNSGPRDGFGWDAEALRDLLGFGRWVFLSTVVSFLATHLDRILLGRFLTMADLGLYSIGMTFARVAIHTATRLGSTVLFPLLARRQDDPARLIRSCLKARRAILWASGAVCTAFALAAPFFFETLYDARYRGAGSISRWLAVYTWSHVLVASMDRIPLALGKPRTLFIANTVATLGMLLAAVGYRLAALPGFIIGMTAANLLAHAYLIWSLPVGRLSMAAQSALATVGFGLYAVLSIGLLDVLVGHLSWWVNGLVTGTLAGLPGLLAAWQIRKQLAQKRDA